MIFMLFLQIGKEKIEKVLYNYRRQKFLKNTIANIGEIVEEEDSITCIVKQEKLDSNKKYCNIFYELNLYGMITHYEKSKQLVDYYKLNKPVHYFFDGIHFNKPINIFSLFCNITFINCTFENAPIQILSAEEITFSKNTYYDCISAVRNSAFLRTISGTTIGKLYFVKENFKNEWDKKNYENKFEINIVAEEIHIYKSTIATDETKGNLSLKAKDIDIVKSTLESSEIYFDTDHIDVTKSNLIATKGLIAGNKENNSNIEICLDDVYSPYVLFNNIEWVNFENSNTSFFHDYPELLIKKRRKLANTLQNIKLLMESFMSSRNNTKDISTNADINNDPIKILLKK